MARILVLLVGEQPTPNLLPTRHLRPDRVLLVHTDHPRIRVIAARLRELLPPEVSRDLCQVDPYDLATIEAALLERLAQLPPDDRVELNLTGGTKPMAMAGLEVARQRGSTFYYFQTEGNRSCLSAYRFDGGRITRLGTEELAETISLDDYLLWHVGAYEDGPPRSPLEREVADALQAPPVGAQVLTSVRPRRQPSLEIDFLVRCGNQVGVGEVKPIARKDAIDQLNSACLPQNLGTYAHKFLITAKLVGPDNELLAKAYGIEVIELRGYREGSLLPAEDKQLLVERVTQKLGRRA